MAVRVTLECGHTSVLRSRTTPQGYTHDWEVFLRGVDNADVHQYIDKVVFILHETFPKPKRVVKEPPYSVRESGYAGFVILINVYLKKKDEPKKFQIPYDLHLQQSGPAINKVIRHDELFSNPPDDFRRKLLKGGATIVTSLEGAPDKGEPQATLAMIGKPKLSGSDVKKHRPPEPRTSNSFHDLFGEPIKTAKVSPDNKKALVMDKGANPKPTVPAEKIEKQDKLPKVKHSPNKDGKRDKSGEDKKTEKKDKDHLRERERSKEKSKRPQSPAVKSSHLSPGVKRVSSPLPPPKKPPSPPLPTLVNKRPLSPKPREKESKKPSHEREKERGEGKEKEKDKSKVSSDAVIKGEKRKDKKKHKEDRDKDKKDKHKERDRDKSKENNTKYNDKIDKPEIVKQEKVDRVEKNVEKQLEKQEKIDKDKIQETVVRPPKDVRKSPKPCKEIESKPKEEKPVKIEKPEKVEKVEKVEKNKDGKGEREKQKHKHKKRDKKDRGDGSKEREKKEKKDRSKSAGDKQNNISIPQPPSSCPPSTLLAHMPERDTSDSAPSPDEDMPINDTKQVIMPQDSPPTPPPQTESSRPASPPPLIVKKEKTEKIKKDKSKGSRGEERESRKRKRKNSYKGDDEPTERGLKREKDRIRSPSLPLEPVSSSQSPVATDTESAQPSKVKDEEIEEDNIKEEDGDGEVEQVAPDSTNNTLTEVDAGDPPVFSEDYVSQLKDLQQKIMTLQDNQELQRVVQVIAETGQYEITKKTFDFDLCALDRRTVQRLQEFFSTS